MVNWFEAVPARQRDDPIDYGRALLYTEQSARAIEIFQQLVDDDSADIRALGHLGMALAMAGRTDSARQIDFRLQSAESFLPWYSWEWRGYVAAALGDTTEAVVFLSKSVELGISCCFRWHADPDVDPLRDNAAFQELISPKR
jgi:hypothetical protein